MMTPAAALMAAAPATLRREPVEPLRQALAHLEHRLPARADSTVLLDFLEEDLREGLEALGDLEAHFDEVLEVLQPDALCPMALLEAGEDALVLRRLDTLVDVVTRVRRRLSQAAGLLRQTPTT